MAKIVPCKTCKKEVSSAAPTCPHCGEKAPGVAMTKDMWKGLIFLVIVVGMWWSYSSSDKQKSPEKPTSSSIAETAQKETDCRKDLQCWGGKNIIDADVRCRDGVESLARYEVKWTDGFSELKFSRFRWIDQMKGTITYVGDKVMFQNGFGAYQRHAYECDFDPENKEVLDVRAAPGDVNTAIFLPKSEVTEEPQKTAVMSKEKEPRAVPVQHVKCSEVKYGSNSYADKMGELVTIAKLSTDETYNRFQEDVVRELCRGNQDGEVEKIVMDGLVSQSEVNAIKEVLVED